MSSALANAFSKWSSLVTVKSFFSLTAASFALFLLLNIRIEKVLNEKTGRSLGAIQLVLEFQTPFASDDDSPIHDAATEPDAANTTSSSSLDATPREDFSYLFSTMPHECVMEQDCTCFCRTRRTSATRRSW